MYPIQFSKADAERLAATLGAGEGGLQPPGGKWSSLAMIQVAGACLFGAMSHGPIRPGLPAAHRLPTEHREAVDCDFQQDLHAAIEVCCQLMMAVVDGEYDDRFEEVVMAGVTHGEEGPKVQPFQGFKKIQG
jgi:hypothetical protein